ncbi:hypothetical protein cyc_04965 [Cyclospora cayetanensis]|uniref:Uncharacterized protein n=1 Tax=Cyclospora cayetanensis TaxID=88456 RepID=A0A1D3DAE7_9EIME|nr:hypothetical protein cyc_04965 [Cyclospora cayetanensis]
MSADKQQQTLLGSSKGEGLKGKSRRRPHALRLLGGLRSQAKQGFVARVLHSRTFISRFSISSAMRQQPPTAAAPVIGGSHKALGWRAKAFRVAGRGRRGFFRGLGAPLSAGNGTKAAAAAAAAATAAGKAPRGQERQEGGGDEEEEGWFDSTSWAVSLWGFGSQAAASDTDDVSPTRSGVQTPDGACKGRMPSLEGPCLCIWQLTSVGPSGAPRLVSVITCDDLLHTRARLAASASQAASDMQEGAAAGSSGGTWDVVATHIPTCFCLAVLQEGPLCCPACLAAAAGCPDSCCSSSLRATCCNGSCAALRCVVYGDTEGSVHAVEVGLEEEVIRWGAHPGAPIVSVAVTRAFGWGSAAPEVWLVTAAAPSGSRGEGMMLRCWSVVGLGEGGPVLLHQLHVGAEAVVPPGVSLHPSSSSSRNTAAPAAGRSGAPSALARLLGAHKKAGDAESNAANKQSAVFPLGGRRSMVTEEGELLLLAGV